jgi:hypothetical protein
MKKLLLLVSMAMGSLAFAQTYPLNEDFDAVTVTGNPQTGPLPTGWTTGAGSQFMVYGLENLQPHGYSVNNSCSVEMSASHTNDTLITPLIGLTANSKLSISYRFVNKASYPSTGYQLITGDKVLIDAYIGSSWQNAVATIDVTTNPNPLNTYTTYTYTSTNFATLVGFGITSLKIRMDVIRAGGDWYLDIDNFIFADNISGVSYNVLNPPSLIAYPNPSSGNFSVWLKNYKANQPVELKMFNHMGQLVKTQHADNILNNQFNVTTTDLAKGVYMIEVQSGDEHSTTKIIIE